MRHLALGILAFALLASHSSLALAEATITLGRDPEPPFCATNPGGIIDITWDIEHTSTPNFVHFQLEDPTRTIILDQQDYPGSTGLTINRQWVVPPAVPDGKFWIRVEYWSFEAGNEANAEVTFYVCAEQGTICATKYEDTNCDGLLDPGDTPVQGYWLCIDTPFGDQLCAQTDAAGQVCWDNIPVGAYDVYEQALAGWVPEGPTSYSTTLVASQQQDFTFLNSRYATCYGACCLPVTGDCQVEREDACTALSGAWLQGEECDPNPCTPSVPTEKATWGRIKTLYR